jgi:hypothetical protein
MDPVSISTWKQGPTQSGNRGIRGKGAKLDKFSFICYTFFKLGKNYKFLVNEI